MPLVTVTDVSVKQAGNFLLLIGPAIATLTSPSLATFTTNATCPVREFAADTTVSFTEDQSMCDTDAKTQLDKRVRTLGPIRFRVNKANYDTLRSLHAEDAAIGMFVRPFDPSTTEAAVADKGTAYNAKVAKFELLSAIAVGSEYEVIAEYYDVSRAEAVLVA